MVNSMRFDNPKFTGNLKPSGVPMQLKGNSAIYGLIVDEEAPSVRFGHVVSIANHPNSVMEGISDIGAEIMGIAVYSQAIAQLSPCGNDRYLSQMPCAVLMDGFAWFYPQNIDQITRVSKVFADIETGEISFGAGSFELNWMKVVLKDEKNKRVLVKVDISKTTNEVDIDKYSIHGLFGKSNMNVTFGTGATSYLPTKDDIVLVYLQTSDTEGMLVPFAYKSTENAPSSDQDILKFQYDDSNYIMFGLRYPNGGDQTEVGNFYTIFTDTGMDGNKYSIIIDTAPIEYDEVLEITPEGRQSYEIARMLSEDSFVHIKVESTTETLYDAIPTMNWYKDEEGGTYQGSIKVQSGVSYVNLLTYYFNEYTADNGETTVGNYVTLTPSDLIDGGKLTISIKY